MKLRWGGDPRTTESNWIQSAAPEREKKVKRMNSVHGLERKNSDIAQLENYIGHECEAGVKVLML